MDLDDAAIGWSGLALSLLLVGVAVFLSWWRGLRLERELLWATARALAQLLAVGGVLAVVVRDDSPVLLAWAWVVAMVVMAAFTVQHRSHENHPDVPNLVPLALLATGLSSAVGLGVVFGLGVYPTAGRAIVPIAGMLVGNSIGATVIAGRRIVGGLAEQRADVEARLALGQPWQEASKPCVRQALSTALTTQIESTKAVGLVFLPGAMTGLILAGAKPIDAVLVQAALMYLILGAVAVNVTVVGLGLTRKLFTSDHRLVRLTRSST